MARVGSNASFVSELASGALYKRNQGRLTRQLTALAVIAIVLFGCWSFANTILSDSDGLLIRAAWLVGLLDGVTVETAEGPETRPPSRSDIEWTGGWRLASALVNPGIPTFLALLGIWFAYRLVNYPKFADFLISVEAEMDKVSWPDRTYLYRATAVVLSVMVLMSAYLWLWDIAWMQIFDFIGFLDIQALRGQ